MWRPTSKEKECLCRKSKRPRGLLGYPAILVLRPILCIKSLQIRAARSVELSRQSTSLDEFGRSAVADSHNVIDVIAHGHEQIEKQFATDLHLHLHGSAPLESLTTSNDES